MLGLIILSGTFNPNRQAGLTDGAILFYSKFQFSTIQISTIKMHVAIPKLGHIFMVKP